MTIYEKLLLQSVPCVTKLKFKQLNEKKAN